MQNKANQSIKDAFNSISEEGRYITKTDVLDLFQIYGIQHTDYRIAQIMHRLSFYEVYDKIFFKDFEHIIEQDFSILERCCQHNFVIPDFANFTSKIRDIFKNVSNIETGEVANYIPELAKINGNKFGLSICTIDGQIFNIGDSFEKFCVQSICKPINYCIALEDHGVEYVHRYVGREPSGKSFNELSLNTENIPYNPMINSGALITSTLIDNQTSINQRCERIHNIWSNLGGEANINYNHQVYKSEKETANRNFALAYLMKEVGAFPKNTDIEDVLDFYFRSCAIETNTEIMSIIAASFANGGVCPTTNKRVFQKESIKNALSLMHSCGMYNFSGEFAFKVGLPAKSGVSGALMLVIPNVMGIAIWSPKLDVNSNPVRGVAFCEELVKKFPLHIYDYLLNIENDMILRQNTSKCLASQIFSFMYNAARGDINEMKRMICHGIDIDVQDYDRRTALHIAVQHNQTKTINFLMSLDANTDIKDNEGNTALSNAKKLGLVNVVGMLKSNHK